MPQRVPDIEEVLSRFQRVRRSGTGIWKWAAACPCRQDDRNPSCNIGQAASGQIVFKCHREPDPCTQEEICDAIGMPPDDLRPNAPPSGAQRREEYDYVDVEGRPVLRVVRLSGGGSKRFWQEHYENGNWETGAVPEDERPLYHLPEVLAQVRDGGTVYVVEGEKDVHTLQGMGVVATTNSGGAGRWLPHHTRSLAGADVVVIADKDEAGLSHALKVARELREAGANVEVFEARIGNDVSDHVGAGLGLGDLVLVPAGIQDDFTRYIEFLDGLDPTLPTEIRFQMARVLLDEAEGDQVPWTSEGPARRGDDDQLFEALRAWRREQASTQGVPAFIVFYDRTLRDLVDRRPSNHQQLLEVWGIGPVKLERYGDALLALLWHDD